VTGEFAQRHEVLDSDWPSFPVGWISVFAFWHWQFRLGVRFARGGADWYFVYDKAEI
jgi:hypothetical protein